MMMPGRSYAASGKYRYGFNGKENDNEVKGIEGAQIQFEYRIYDARLGRFLTMDPLSNDYPWQSSYAYHRNNPVTYVDYLGAGDPPVEPKRQMVKVQKNQSLWSIAKNALPEGSSNKMISAKVNDIKCINKLKGSKVETGQTLYLETSEQFKGRQTAYLIAKEAYDRKEFESFPKPIQDSRNKTQIRPSSYFDEQGNFTQTASTYAGLLDNSFTGVDVSILKGRLLNSLMESVNEYGAPDNFTFYQELANQFITSGKTYISGQIQGRFGPINKAKAFVTGGTWLMRNAQIKYWVTRASNGTISITINAYDYFNVTPQNDKDDSYNSKGKVLNILHKAGGANTNMQTRATWQVNIK